jgi:hypothetical protein
MVLVLAGGIAVPVAGDEDRPVDCPWPATLWAATENAVAGRTWSFRYLEFRDGVARYRAIDAWFAAPKISEEDARWFVTEPVEPLPSFLSVVSRRTPWSGLGSLCRALDGGGIDLFQETAGTLCERGGRGGDVRTIVPYDGTLYGVLARPRPGDERCAPDKSGARRRPGSRSTVFSLKPDGNPREDDSQSAAARSVIEPWRRYLDEEGDDGSGPEGLAALPVAASMIDRLMMLTAGNVPFGLRSDLHLAVAVGAPRGYVVALAVEVLERPLSHRELLAALLLLGDRPAPEATEDLIALVRRSDDDRVVALSLRALLRADATAARMEALNLLSDPTDVPTAALGVFAVTEVGFDSGLEALDLEDHDAVCEAAVVVVNRLASMAADSDLRRAAAELIQRQAAGTEREE